MEWRYCPIHERSITLSWTQFNDPLNRLRWLRHVLCMSTDWLCRFSVAGNNRKMSQHAQAKAWRRCVKTLTIELPGWVGIRETSKHGDWTLWEMRFDVSVTGVIALEIIPHLYSPSSLQSLDFFSHCYSTFPGGNKNQSTFLQDWQI